MPTVVVTLTQNPSKDIPSPSYSYSFQETAIRFRNRSGLCWVDVHPQCGALQIAPAPNRLLHVLEHKLDTELIHGHLLNVLGKARGFGHGRSRS